MHARFRRISSSLTAITLLLVANGHRNQAQASASEAPQEKEPVAVAPTEGNSSETNAIDAELTTQTHATPKAGEEPLPIARAAPAVSELLAGHDTAEVVLTRSASWFVFPEGCSGVENDHDLVVHFHGAHSTVIPRYLDSKLNAVLVIINKGNLGSGPYSKALAIRQQVDDLLTRIENTIAEHCEIAPRPARRIALSSWSAGYGATQQVLRFRASRVDAVLLSDGLHVGFTNARKRHVRLGQMPEFTQFAARAARGDKLMAITHSAIVPTEYAGSGETAMALANVAHAPCWPLLEDRHGMTQLTTARRGQFFVDGFAGNDKAAHASHLYSLDKTVFARLRGYWSG